MVLNLSSRYLTFLEQNVNNMKEWMAFQGYEDISNYWGSTETQMEGWSNMNHTSTQRETNLSPLTCNIQPSPSLSLGQGIHQQPPNADTNGCLGQPDQGRISTLED